MRSLISPLVRALSSEVNVGALKGKGAGQERTTIVQNLPTAIYRVFAELEKRISTPPSQDPLTRLTANEAARQIREGKLTSYEYVKAYIERIRDANRYINAVSELYEYEALTQAKEVDKYLKELDRSSEAFKNLAVDKPLLGIPVSVKHSFDVKGWRNICGLPHFRKNPPASEDAGVIKKVREAGGIPFCYTNVPEACFWAETSNKVYGTTSSPYDDRTTPGGSSGGEGALLAAEGSILGIGSDFGGSLRNPAFMNGIFSFKPVGTDIPIEGHFPYNDSEEFKTVAVAGPMTRYAKDMALMFSALSGKKIPDNYASLKPTKVLHTLDSSNGATPLSPIVKDAVHTVANALSEGFSIKNEAFELQPFERMVDCLVNELVHPYPHDGGLIKTAFPDGDKSNFLSEMLKCMMGFGKINPGTTLAIKTFSEPKSDAEHHRMHDELLGYRKWIETELKDNVVLVAPPLPRNHYLHHEHKVSGYSDWHSTAIFNGLAVPVACAPIGLDSNGYPMSVQLVSARGNEFLLIRMQEFLEKKFGGWKPPRTFE